MPNDTTPCDQPAAHPHTCDCTPSPPVPDPTPFRARRNGVVGQALGGDHLELDQQWQLMWSRLRDVMGPEFAGALDANVGARMADAVRPLLDGCHAIRSTLQALPANEACVAVSTITETLIDRYDPSF